LVGRSVGWLVGSFVRSFVGCLVACLLACFMEIMNMWCRVTVLSVNYEVAKKWKKAAVAQFQVLGIQLLLTYEEDDERRQSGYPVFGLRFGPGISQ
jgi:hypothetical protein